MRTCALVGRYNISATNVSLGVLGLGSSVGCESVLTYGNWSQGWQWNWGSVSQPCTPSFTCRRVDRQQAAGIQAATLILIS